MTAPQGGLAVGAHFELPDGRHELGRLRSATICLGADNRAARRHAILEIDGEQVRITDLGGISGVLLDGTRIARAEVRVGSFVLLGGTELQRTA